MTGNANGPLGAYLVHCGVVRPGDGVSPYGGPGRKIGRPGNMRVEVGRSERSPGRRPDRRGGGHRVFDGAGTWR